MTGTTVFHSTCATILAMVIAFSPATRANDCEGERRAVLKDQGFVDLYKVQLETMAKQLKRLKPTADRLIAKAKEQASAARNEVAWNFVETLINELLSKVVAAGPLGPIIETVGAAGDPLGQVPGVEYVRYFNALKSYYDILGGDLSKVAKLAEEQNLPATKKFVNTMRDLEALESLARMIVNDMDEIRVDLEQAEKKLQESKQALADCEGKKGKSDPCDTGGPGAGTCR